MLRDFSLIPWLLEGLNRPRSFATDRVSTFYLSEAHYIQDALALGLIAGNGASDLERIEELVLPARWTRIGSYTNYEVYDQEGRLRISANETKVVIPRAMTVEIVPCETLGKAVLKHYTGEVVAETSWRFGLPNAHAKAHAAFALRTWALRELLDSDCPSAYWDISEVKNCLKELPVQIADESAY